MWCRSLGESGQVTLDGTQPLSERESTLVRQTLATRLALSPKQLDNVKDDIRYLQRKVVLQMAEEAASQAEKASGSRPTSPGVVPSAGATRVTAVSPSTPQSTSQPADISLVREMMMELQGRGKPVKDEGEVLKRIRKKQKKLMEVKPSLVEVRRRGGMRASGRDACVGEGVGGSGSGSRGAKERERRHSTLARRRRGGGGRDSTYR